ncbi:Appr-1-p processing domain protein [Staphylothermus marinus F1]|uniref:Appr-1-p processing domain protein n=1 Tax=Staphylothermus marinus (strain ATCC 43588 / DSM 3639 / JCM 9404 / F1) TaxID=399550 RepID=A3DLM0_STAMF|nr:macro domain-containing protein [Staphylothermus marinus]ABN69530.1 Appr-1-p processing domain protein [Staphylothermus marinus F1]
MVRIEEICKINYRGAVIKGVKGDITELDVEAIVNPANSFMLMGGGLAGVLKRKGGEIIENEAKKFAPVPVGKAVVTIAGVLKAKYIIHAPTMEKPAMRINPENAYKATFAALTKAFDLSLNRIAVPGMGTGVGGLSPSDAGKAMAKAIKEFLDIIPSGIKEILVVDLNPEIPRMVCKALQEMIREARNENQS